jgi:hypothetical protein
LASVGGDASARTRGTSLSVVTLITGTASSVVAAFIAYFFADSEAVLYSLLIGLIGVALTLILDQRLKTHDIENLVKSASQEALVAAEIARLSEIDEIFGMKYAELKGEMADLARGIYQVRTLTSLYQDDIRSIGMLRSGDILLSTCPVNPASVEEGVRQITSPAYRESINAHLAAAMRGVKVTRIYLLRDMRTFRHTPITRHLTELEQAGIDIRVILRDQVILDSQFDFLVFGNSKVSVGVAEPGAGTVSGAIVYTDRALVQKYIAEYDKLRVMSTSPSAIIGGQAGKKAVAK